MFRSYTNEFKYNLRNKLDISKIIDVFISEDMEKTLPEFRMWFRMNFTSGVFSVIKLLRYYARSDRSIELLNLYVILYR